MATNPVKINCGALIYCSKTKRYLFLLRNHGKFSNTWGIVGGKVEHNETVLQGLQREIGEELGGKINDAKFIPIDQYTSEQKSFFYHTFLIKVEEEFVPELNPEHKGYCWVKLSDHPRPLHPGVWRTIQLTSTRRKLETVECLNDIT